MIFPLRFQLDANPLTFEWCAVRELVTMFAMLYLIHFTVVGIVGADGTWPSIGHSWLQTCRFGPHHPPSWRNAGSYRVTAWKSPWLEASTRSRPWKTWLQQVIADQTDSLWHWHDLVASPWSFCWPVVAAGRLPYPCCDPVCSVWQLCFIVPSLSSTR